MLAEEVGDQVEVTLIDKGDAFVFGYAKLDVMFGRSTLDDSAPAVLLVRARASGCSARRSPRSTRRPRS